MISESCKKSTVYIFILILLFLKKINIVAHYVHADMQNNTNSIKKQSLEDVIAIFLIFLNIRKQKTTLNCQGQKKIVS